MLTFKEKLKFYSELAKKPQILKAPFSVVQFLLKYMSKFNVVKAGKDYIIHSHLPPVNSKAYSRFINEHLVKDSKGPSHAQIGITNACPQNCEYCYNKKRTGTSLSTKEILKTIAELKAMGVFWLGLTGGEPLLNKDIVEIVESASDTCAVKLFTTGCTLTEELAKSLKKAGLFSVSVSLDSSKMEEHDKVRNYKGAFTTALKAIDIFKSTGMHVSVSAVLSKKMINSGETEDFLGFIEELGVHEAWLCEEKPLLTAYNNKENIITEAEKHRLQVLQDEYNKKGGMTINYLGHFESKEHFGCNAGYKMIYIDAFGQVSPCVFIPMTFGNIKNKSVTDIWESMSRKFQSEDTCFINKNYSLLRKYYKGTSPINVKDSMKLMDEVVFGPHAKFLKINSK